MRLYDKYVICKPIIRQIAPKCPHNVAKIVIIAAYLAARSFKEGNKTISHISRNVAVEIGEVTKLERKDQARLNSLRLAAEFRVKEARVAQRMKQITN